MYFYTVLMNLGKVIMRSIATRDSVQTPAGSLLPSPKVPLKVTKVADFKY
jgi:hypothetical protein